MIRSPWIRTLAGLDAVELANLGKPATFYKEWSVVGTYALSDVGLPFVCPADAQITELAVAVRTAGDGTTTVRVNNLTTAFASNLDATLGSFNTSQLETGLTSWTVAAGDVINMQIFGVGFTGAGQPEDLTVGVLARLL